MKKILAKRSNWRSIGLLVSEREVAFCVVAGTPLGRVELASGYEIRSGETLDNQVDRMLGSWLVGKPRPKVVLGIPEVRVFHAAREMGSGGRKDPEVWLQESLQSAGTRIEDMVTDVLEVGVNKRSMAVLVSCRKKGMAEPLEMLKRRASRLVLVEPTPCALLRAARDQIKEPRGCKLSARFLLGEKQALGLLAVGALPLHWWVFDLPSGEETLAVHSAFVRMKMQAKNWRVDQDLDHVIIQGRPELGNKLGAVEFGQRIGTRVIRGETPEYEPTAIARGLALGGLVEERLFDLSRSFKTRESIGEIFPWGDLVMQTAILLGVLLLLSDRARTLDQQLSATRREMIKYKWLGNKQEGELDKEKKNLDVKARTAEAFLASRVDWSNYLRDVASHLPDNTRLSSIAAQAELENLTGKPAAGLIKRSFVMKLETPIPPTNETPREIDRLLGLLRDRSVIRQEFPVIELKDLKTMNAVNKNDVAVASYSIVCMPPAPKAGGSKKASSGS